MKTFFLLRIVALAGVTAVLFAQQQPIAPGVPVSMVITLEPRRGKTIPAIEQQDITVSQGKDKRPVVQLTPLQGNMQLMLLIDDSARASFDTEIGTLKQFVNSLPANTEVAIAYMSHGTVQMAQNFTRDHAAAANSLRIAIGAGGADVSPYDSLSEVVKHWPNSGAERKEVIMISSGIEELGGGLDPENPYVDAGIHDAQQAGVVVYAIYSPSVGHFGHSYWRNTWGQNFLSQLADETGGESYIIGFGSPVTFQPFLDQILQQFQHQYLLTFLARPEQKSGLQPVKVSVLEKDASVAAPDRIFVRAGM